jgi:hypothetical protein
MQAVQDLVRNGAIAGAMKAQLPALLALDLV